MRGRAIAVRDQPAMNALYPVRAYWIPIAITIRPM